LFREWKKLIFLPLTVKIYLPILLLACATATAAPVKSKPAAPAETPRLITLEDAYNMALQGDQTIRIA